MRLFGIVMPVLTFVGTGIFYYAKQVEPKHYFLVTLLTVIAQTM